ncbi:unnamed protein product [Owenia fusiformis]|uniref:Uncharacterized protein n=1 Tax=Owenia fusiformis TaxID=6347 RepID=A0A8J1U3X6_OWEFU|nr:unnamed protein product [Owenia fusiformis]
MNVHSRDCSSCTSKLSLCKLNSSEHTMFIDYLAMENYMDSHMSILRGKLPHPGSEVCRQNREQNKDWDVYCPESITTQQVLFNEYLPAQRVYPDVIILVGSQHETFRRNTRASSRALTWLLDLIDQRVKNTTRVLFLEQTTGNDNLKPNIFQKWTGESRLEAIREDSFKVLSSALKYSSVLYPFYGLASISRDVISWNMDGVHYHNDFYEAMVHLIIGAL